MRDWWVSQNRVTFFDPQIAQISQIGFYLCRNRRNLRNLWIIEPFDL
jgi:hypothetical protein